MTGTHERNAARNLSFVGLTIVVVVYLVIIQFGGILIQKATGEDDIFSLRGLVFTMIVPLGIALAFTYAVIARLGWWTPVLRDDKPVQKWVWVVPILLILAIAIGIDYSALADKGIVYVVLLLIATQFVGWGEEGMFRGIGVVTLRRHGLTEGKVALWSSVIFGAVHLTNVISHGISALPQAVIVSVAGYFFYLTRRVSRGNALNSILHGLFDFSLLTGSAIVVGQSLYLGSMAPILAYPILVIILLVRRKHIEPAA